MNGKGLIFGYFFGPHIMDPARATIPHEIKPRDALLVGKFGDLGLVNGAWPLLGESHCWREEEWRMPPMVRINTGEGTAFLSVYDEDSFECVSEKPCDPGLVDQYPYDRTMGYGAVEIRLTSLLNPKKD
jgi:hypothetical protein